MRIRKKITLSMLVTAVIPLLISIGLALWQSTAITKTLTLDVVQARLDTAAQKLSLFFSERIAEVSTYSQTSVFKTMSFPEIRPFLMSELSRHENIYEKFILGTPEGHFYNTSGGNPWVGGLRTFDDKRPDAKPKHIRKRDYWQQTVGKNSSANENTYVSNPMISYTTGAKQIVVASTIISPTREVVGMIGGALPWADIKKRVKQVNDEMHEDLEWEAKFFLISHTGVYWYHWDPDYVVQLKKDNEGNQVINEIGEKVITRKRILDDNIPEFVSAGKRMINGESGYQLYTDPRSGEKNHIVFSHIPSANYSIGIVVPDKAILAPVKSMQNLFLYILMIATILVLSVAFFISRKVSSPIISLNSMSKDLTQGDWDKKIKPVGNDEIRELTESFNTMAESLKSREASLLLSEQRLAKINVELEKRIEERTQQLKVSNANLKDQIEEKNLIEIELRNSEELLQSTGKLAHIGGWKLDIQTNTLSWTDETFRIHEMPPGQTPDMDMATKYLLPDSRSEFESAINLAKEYGTAFDIEVVLQCDNRARKYLRVICSISRKGDAITELVGSYQDITELKKVEKLKNEFISMVSHELRTPLTSISGSLSLLKSGEVTKVEPEALGLLEIAGRNSERLLLLINDLLDMEKVEAGKMDFIYTVESLPDLLTQAIEENQNYGDKYDVGFNLSGKINTVNVRVDKQRFLQVMSNLMSNAAKFTRQGTNVEISTSLLGQGMVQVSVLDYGDGIPEEFTSKIFNKFSQADSSDTRKRGGTGLGLSITKSIIEKMGGTITFDSIKGEGTIFYFTLPVED